MIPKDKMPIIRRVFADNGEHSHYRLVDAVTGKTLWEEPESVLSEVRAVLKAWDNYWELYNKESYTGNEFEIVSSELDKAIDDLRKVSEHFQ